MPQMRPVSDDEMLLLGDVFMHRELYRAFRIQRIRSDWRLSEP